MKLINSSINLTGIACKTVVSPNAAKIKPISRKCGEESNIYFTSPTSPFFFFKSFLSLVAVGFGLESPFAGMSPARTPSIFDVQQRSHHEGDAGKQEESIIRLQGVQDRLHDSHTASSKQAPHQIVHCCRTGASTWVKIDDQGAVDGEESC